MKDFRELSVWRKAHAAALSIYRLTGQFPKEERFGLTIQMRRAATSVPSNLAEGCGRGTDTDFKRFVQIAMGSACELEYQLILAGDLGFCSDVACRDAIDDVVEVKRMLSGLLKKLTAES